MWLFSILLTGMSQNWSHGFEIRTEPYGPTRLTGNCPWNGSFNPKTRYTQKTQWTIQTVVKQLGLENRGWVSRVRSKLEKRRKRRSVVPFSLLNFVFLSLILTTNPKMQSQNTLSPQNKKEMKSTNLIFTPSSTFSNFSFFCVYSSFASLVFPFFFCHWCPKPKEIKILRFILFQ